MFVLSLNAFRQRCFHNFSCTEIYCKTFWSRLFCLCHFFRLVCVYVCLCVQVCNFGTYPIKSFAHRAAAAATCFDWVWLRLKRPPFHKHKHLMSLSLRYFEKSCNSRNELSKSHSYIIFLACIFDAINKVCAQDHSSWKFANFPLFHSHSQFGCSSCVRISLFPLISILLWILWFVNYVNLFTQQKHADLYMWLWNCAPYSSQLSSKIKMANDEIFNRHYERDVAAAVIYVIKRETL